MDKLLSKILKDELKEGIITKIHNDLVIGGNSQEEAVLNYIRVLHKLYLANLNMDPAETNIFP